MKILKPIALLLLSAFFIQQNTRAGELSHEYGEVTQADFDLKAEGFLKDADAAVIYDIGESDFYYSDYKFVINFQRKTRIKIFTEAGIENAEITIPFYKSDDFTEKVSDIKAVTYNLENGVITETTLYNSQIFEEKINENWYIKKFTLPSVKAGSIIEFRYDHDTPYKFNLQDWEFQREIPTLFSEYTVHLTPFYNYFFLLQGADHFEKQESFEEKGLPRMYGAMEYRMKTHRFIKENIPAFEEEALITSKEDYIIKLDFQLMSVIRSDGSRIEYMTTWENFIKDLLKDENFGKFQNALERKSKAFVKENNLLALSPAERFLFIVDHVKTHYVWDKRNRLYSQQSASEFLKNQKGNSAEINLFLTALLNAAEIVAYPVILSTRDHGKIKLDYPFYRFFNYVVVAAIIDDKLVMTDGSAIYLRNDKIPSKCFNDKGLIMKSDEVEWLPLTDTQISSNFININIKISPDFDTITADISDVSQLYIAEEMKSVFGDNLIDLKKSVENKGYEQVNVSETRNFDDPNKPYIVIYSIKKGIDHFDDKYLVPPFLNEPVSKNPLKGKERNYPMDMTYPKRFTFMTEITIPKGYKLTGIPAAQNYDDDLTASKYNITSTDSTVSINASYEFKKSVYSYTKYHKLKAFYNQIIKQFNENLVFEKTNEEAKMD